MQRIDLNDARTSCNCFTADAINLDTIRAKLQKDQYKYTLVYVVAALLNNTQCWEWASISELIIYIGHFGNCNLSRLTFHVHQFGNFYPFFWLRKKKSEIIEKVSRHINTEILNEFKFKNYIFLIIFV
jgi:hypothetical protein